MFYKRFRLTLYTLSPVHIGSGEKYTAREFIYENKSYYFPDMGRFYSEIIKLGLEEKFEKFLIASLNKKDKKQRLIAFIKDNRIKSRDFGGYTLSVTDMGWRNSDMGGVNDISRFIRDGLGQVYIPGSSLKGAIRTILMNTYWKNENFVIKKGRKSKENTHKIPWRPGRKNQKSKDIFHNIRVSDSPSFSNDDLMIAQKLDYSKRKKEPRPIPLYRESLAPLKKTSFIITTTSEEAYKLIQSLPTLAKEFYEDYMDFFLREASNEEFIQNNLLSPLYLGAGSGVWTKTVFEQADGIIQEVYGRGKLTKMVGKGVVKLTKAPLKKYKTKEKGINYLIKNNQHLYEMGKACFSLKEI